VGREEEARAVLVRIHHANEVEPEMANIKEDERVAQAANAYKWSDLFSSVRNMRYRTVIAVAVTSLQQLTGINAIM
jgi:Sugar (and other) transporter